MNTTISISKETRDILQDYGKKSEKYDDIIKRMYNSIRIQEKIEEFLNENAYSSIEDVEERIKLRFKK